MLIGTQMVAKGHDFPDVSLGVVLDADATLRFPDFRAEERTFALIAQLAGRAGRGGHGRVLVQTIAPDARAIVHAARHDSDGFLAGELERRRALSYPPFSHLVRIVLAAESPRLRRPRPRASVRARLLGTALDELGRRRARSRGAVPPARARALRARRQGAERRGAVAAVGAAVSDLAASRVHAGVSFSVDVDPQ